MVVVLSSPSWKTQPSCDERVSGKHLPSIAEAVSLSGHLQASGCDPWLFPDGKEKHSIAGSPRSSSAPDPKAHTLSAESQDPVCPVYSGVLTLEPGDARVGSLLLWALITSGPGI